MRHLIEARSSGEGEALGPYRQGLRRCVCVRGQGKRREVAPGAPSLGRRIRRALGGRVVAARARRDILVDASSVRFEALVARRTGVLSVRWRGGGALHCIDVHNFGIPAVAQCRVVVALPRQMRRQGEGARSRWETELRARGTALRRLRPWRCGCRPQATPRGSLAISG